MLGLGPMPIKKRRPVKHLNKNDEGLRRRAEEQHRLQSVGTLRSRFPSVISLEVQIEILSRERHVLSSETRRFQGDDILSFKLDCVGRCGNGTMDMEGLIVQMVNNKQTTRQSKAYCKQKLFIESNEECGCEYNCHIAIQYFPPSE